MAPNSKDGSAKGVMNRGAWAPEEDRKLAQYIEMHGAKKWKTVALEAGLNRCGKSCRLRWLNYLRPNIKRGNISLEEEDLILRLHKLLGNRWSLIAGRLPGRTDNEIKNYWNTHLSKKVNPAKRTNVMETSVAMQEMTEPEMSRKGSNSNAEVEPNPNLGENKDINFDYNDDFFGLKVEENFDMDWISEFLEF